MHVLWIEFGALTLLVSLLFWSSARRLWRQGKNSGKIATPLGHGFDAVPVKQRLDHLRQDHSAVAAQRAHRTPGHDLVVAAIRRSVTKLVYFRPVHLGNLEDPNPNSEKRYN
jgi:hypothetical protein